LDADSTWICAAFVAVITAWGGTALHMQDDVNTKDVGVEYCVVIDLLCPNIVFAVRWISEKSLPSGTMVEENTNPFIHDTVLHS
jgi:hypothetical protein